MKILIKRIYEPFSTHDGHRILVDRLWPRGIRKENACLDRWMKDVAPSAKLRQWFNHDPEKWEQFKGKYWLELNGSPVFAELGALAREHNTVTFLFAAKDTEHNHAVALKQFIHNP